MLRVLLLLVLVPTLMPIFAEEFSSNTDVYSIHITIQPVHGSGVPTCAETTQGCYLPDNVIVDQDGWITFYNTDYEAHTFTSGSPMQGPDGVFNSGLLQPGDSAEWYPSEIGSYNYFCQIHPWMTGSITVVRHI